MPHSALVRITPHHIVTAIFYPDHDEPSWDIVIRQSTTNCVTATLNVPGNKETAEIALLAGLEMARTIEARMADTPTWTENQRAIENKNPARSLHSHWSHYNENLEMASWNELSAFLVDGDLDAANAGPAVRLCELAKNYGYGEADNFLCSPAGSDSESQDPPDAASRDQYQKYADGDYWNCIERSENVCIDILPFAPLRETVIAVAQKMREDFLAGRIMREEQNRRSETTVEVV